MKFQLKKIIKNLDPKLFGVKEIKISTFRKLGFGESNLNYFLVISNKKFICRLTLDNDQTNKVEEEFNNLKIIAPFGLSPKPIYFRKKDSLFNRNFSILEFIEGKPFRKGQKSFTDKEIKLLAKTLAELHKHKSSKLPKLNSNAYLEVFSWAKKFEKDINKLTRNKFKRTLSSINKKISSTIINEHHPYSISHNDICPQNVVVQKNRLFFIDWESVSLSDPARDVGTVIDEFGLKDNQLDLFFKIYLSLRKDHSLKKRIKAHIILKINNYFFWELRRILEIKNHNLSKDYLNKNSVKMHLNEAKRQYKKLRKLVDIPDFDFDLFLTYQN